MSRPSEPAVEVLGMLAKWAVEHRTPFATWGNGMTRQIADVRFTLIDRLGVLRLRWNITEDVAIAWQMVHASAPDEASLQAFHAFLEGRANPSLGAWLEVGDIGPDAFAAGLTLTEVWDRLATAEGADLTEMRMLASLRGWIMPDLTERHVPHR